LEFIERNDGEYIVAVRPDFEIFITRMLNPVLKDRIEPLATIFTQGKGGMTERKALEEFMDREGLALFWHIEGDKMVRGHWTKDDYPGQLDIKGLYVLSGSGITGNWQFNTL
jgi:hypothetical protein